MQFVIRMIWVVSLAVVSLASGGTAVAQEAAGDADRRAAEIHRRAVLVDGHNDLPWRLRTEARSSFATWDLAGYVPDAHTDIPRLREGGVDAQFFVAYVPAEYRHGGAARYALEQIDLIKRMVDRYPDAFEIARSTEDVRRVVGSEKIAAIVCIEGGHAIENSLAVLRMFYELGARYMTLTHSATLPWADAATDSARHGGLTAFGEEVVREMNRLGMLVDISHVSAETMRDAIRVSEAPVIASHSSARALADHPRNVPDDVLRMLPDNGGVVMVNFYPAFITPRAGEVRRRALEAERRLRAEHEGDEAGFERAWEAWWREHPVPTVDVDQVVDHIDHIVETAGVDHVGLGSDFDGIDVVPVGLEDVSDFPAITEELVERGYSDTEIEKILGGNVLRAWGVAEEVARRLEGATNP